MDNNTLAGLAGVIISLAFSYVPGLKGLYDRLTGDYKRLAMLVVLVVVAAGLFGASCAGVSEKVTCDALGAKTLLSMLLAAAVANQTAYALTPKK